MSVGRKRQTVVHRVETVSVERHPVTGAFAGVLLLLSFVLVLFALGVVPINLWWFAGVLAFGTSLGAVAAFTVPPRWR